LSILRVCVRVCEREIFFQVGRKRINFPHILRNSPRLYRAPAQKFTYPPSSITVLLSVQPAHLPTVHISASRRVAKFYCSKQTHRLIVTAKRGELRRSNVHLRTPRFMTT